MEATGFDRKNIAVLSAMGIASGIALNIFRPLYPILAVSIGIDVSSLGLASTASTGFAVLTLMVAGSTADKLGKKSILSLAYISATAGALLCSQARSLAHIAASLMLFELSFYIGAPMRAVVVAESSPSSKMGTAYAVITTFRVLPNVIAPTLGGLMAEKIGLRPGIASAAAFMAVASAAALAIREEKAEQPALKVSLLPSRSLKPLYIFSSIDRFSWMMWMPIVYAHISKELSATPLQIGALASVMNTSWLLSQMASGILVDKAGALPTLLASEVLGAIAAAVLAASSSYKAALAAFTAIGLSISTWIPSYNKLLAALAPEESRAAEFSKITAYRTTASIPAPLLGGLLYNIAHPMPFAASATILAANTLLLVKMSPKGGSYAGGSRAAVQLKVESCQLA